MRLWYLVPIALAFLPIQVAFAENVLSNPPAARFLCRTQHASIVLGDYLYIDGGEISQLIDGEPTDGQPNADLEYIPGAHQSNVTLSIPLSKSWTNGSVVIRTVDKGSAPVLNQEQLWKSPDGKSCFVWGGSLSEMARQNAEIPSSYALWWFTADGDGGGDCSQEEIGTSLTLERPQQGCSAAVADTYYSIGGLIDRTSDPGSSAHGNGHFQTTIVSYNSTSGLWNGDAAIEWNSQGTTLGARAVTVPAFGLDERALILVMGGLDPASDLSQGSTPAQDVANYTSFDNITFYDPYIDQWYAQKATGEIPAQRKWFCAVSVKGDNGTQEIFIYGGFIVESYRVYGDVYVLSIPGFFWSKAADTIEIKRYWHTCEQGRGNQFISIGGLDNIITPVEERWDIWGNQRLPDPFAQGIGVFNMASMKWQASYDSDAPPYQSPEVVQSWYSSGNQASMEWQSLEIARMFIRDAPVLVNPTIAPSAEPTEQQPQSDSKDEIRIAKGVGLGLGIPSFLVGSAGAWFAWLSYCLKRKKKVALPVHEMSSTPLRPSSAGDSFVSAPESQAVQSRSDRRSDQTSTRDAIAIT